MSYGPWVFPFRRYRNSREAAARAGRSTISRCDNMADSVGPRLSPLAGRPAPTELLVDVARLEREYFERAPDMADPAQRVAFGTSGHRGSSLRGSFLEAHILATTQAICDYRRDQGID